MDMASVIGSIIMFVVAFGCLIISFLQFVEKMPLLNNTYIYSNDKEKENLNKRPYYIQSGIVFFFIGIIFVINGIEFLLKTHWLFYIVIDMAVIVIIYAIISTVVISNKNKKN